MAGRQYIKLCELSDFEDTELRTMLRSIVPERSENEELHRKLWEMAMLGLFLRDSGALREDARALAVAAGQEAPLFWLANRIKEVVATDIYGDGSFSGREATATMLTDPAAFAPYPYRKDRLDVRHMDALALEFPNGSFDIVFCLSSIEHVGGPRGARRAAREMGRVLRPGGRLIITTECLLGSHPFDVPLVDFAIRLITLGRRCSTATPINRAIDAFTPGELRSDIIDPLASMGVALVQPLDLSLAEENYDNVMRHWVDGIPRSASGEHYPHIVLQSYGSPWTSVFLAFEKRA